MKRWFTKFLRKSPPSPREMETTSSRDVELKDFFTDVENLRNFFGSSLATAPPLSKRLLVIHGVGGVGKSSLLRMFRLHCKSAGIPVALASGDEAKSAYDVLSRWAADLKADGVALPTFGKTFEHYREIQAKVDTQAKKVGNRSIDIASKAASKTAEAAGGALAGAAIGSLIPGLGTIIGGTLGGVLGGMGAEALMDWLRGFLKQADIDLLLDPAKKLTDDFIYDVNKVADQRYVVLMLDTFEQMATLDDWMCKLAQPLHRNVLLVIAGRAMPDWSRSWEGWMAHGQIEELQPMTEDVMRLLIRRYFATMRGGEPDPVQMEAIIRFSRGLPMVVTSAVQLWVKYGVDDFQLVKPEIISNLVNRLMEGVPSTLNPALEAAAIVRWFDQPILRAVTGLADVRELYSELRRFPFVRVRAEGLALHDAVRDIIDENLRLQDSERHVELHQRAADYFEKRLERITDPRHGITSEEAERLGLARLYHRIRINEELGIKIFQEMAEQLAKFWLTNRLQKLLNDVNTYPLQQENSRLWREYYNGRLAHLEGNLLRAERVYQEVGESEQAETRLRAYALCDWGEQLGSANRQFGAPQSADRAIEVIHRSLELHPLDGKTILNFRTLRSISERQNRWQDARSAIFQILEYHRRNGDTAGQAEAYFMLRWHYYLVGDFKQMLAAHETAKKLAASFLGLPFIKMKILHTTIGWIEIGRYAEVERNLREIRQLLAELNSTEFSSENDVNLAFVVGVQGKFEEAHQGFERAITLREAADDQFFVGYWNAFRARVLLMQGEDGYTAALSLLQQSLARKERLGTEILQTLDLFGRLHELRQQWTESEDYYREILAQDTGRHYLEASALAGLMRVKYALGKIPSATMLDAETERLENLSQEHEYNNHLASLNLIKGHLAWKETSASQEVALETALHFYRQALVYALRYNRFLLDEVLEGAGMRTTIPSLIPFCLMQGKEGLQILAALRDWWKTGDNRIGVPRYDSLSLIPENLTLLHAEQMARQREPGDHAPQRTVVERIDAVLTTSQ